MMVERALAIYGGNFGAAEGCRNPSPRSGCRSPGCRRQPQPSRPPSGSTQGQLVDTGPEAEAFSARHSAGHLAEVNGGKTYSETSAAAEPRTGSTRKPQRT